MKEQVNSDLVRALGLYIEDYRLIKNIANEFRIYFVALGQRNKLNPNKMLSMIIYKNLFPKDFVDLQKQQGYAHFLLSKETKNRLGEQQMQVLNDEMDDCENALSDIGELFAKNKKELAWGILGTNYETSTYYRDEIEVDKDTDLTTLEKHIHNERKISNQIAKEYEKRKKSLEKKFDGKKLIYEEKLRDQA